MGGVDSSNKALLSAESMTHAGVVVGRGPDDFKALRGMCRLARCVFFFYAVGGSDGTNVLATVERIDPATGVWSAVASMASPSRDGSRLSVPPNRWKTGDILLTR